MDDQDGDLQKIRGLCQLVVDALATNYETCGGRARAVDDRLAIHKTMGALEEFFDSGRRREVECDQQEQDDLGTLEDFEKQYSSFVEQARDQLSVVEKELMHHEAEMRELSVRRGALEQERDVLSQKSSQQLMEIEDLQENSKKIPSERELNQMNLRLRKLEDESGKLSLQKAKLQSTLDRWRKANSPPPDASWPMSSHDSFDRTGDEFAIDHLRERLAEEDKVMQGKIQDLEQQIEASNGEIRKFSQYRSFLATKGESSGA